MVWRCTFSMDTPFCQAEIGYFWLQKAYGRVTMGCMDQGRLKETQGLNSSAWNAHLYIYIWSDCFSWFATPWTSSLWNFGVKMPTCWSTLWTQKVCTLHLFFPTFSMIILSLFLMWLFSTFWSNSYLFAEKNIKRNKSPWDTQNLESEVNQSIQYGGEYILAFVVPSKKWNVFVYLIYCIHSPNLHLFSPCHKHWNMLTAKKCKSLILLQNIISLTKLDSSFCIPSCPNHVFLIASMLNVLNL